MRKLLFLALLLLPARADEPPDAFAEALAAMGIGEDDLGYRPKATWPRYPHPRSVPHVLPFFEDMLAHPLDTYEFTRTLGNAVEDLLTPEKLAEPATAKDRKETLFKPGVVLATDRRIGGFRGYSANLNPRVEEEEPLLRALATLRERSGDPLREKGQSFGGAWAEEEKGPLAELRARVAKVPESIRPALARLVLNVIDAREWIDRGLRNVPRAMREKVFATLEDLSESTPDGTRYHEVIDDVAARIDEHSLHYGCLKALQATQDARRGLHAARPEDGWPSFMFRLKTPWGTVRFSAHRSGHVDDREDDLLLLVDLHHDGVFWGPVGATSPERPLSVALFVEGGGNVGQSIGIDPQEEGGTGEVASGILGCGIVYTSGDDDNCYRTRKWGLGAGLFGLGALIDEAGDDEHVLFENAGAAFGFGWDVVNAFLIDRGNGNDRYEAKRISFGLAEVRSNAFFLDEGGDDTYVLGRGKGFGDVDEREHYTKPKRTTGYAFWLAQVGVFLDLGGTDRYLRRRNDLRKPDSTAKDGATWHVRTRDPEARHGPNVSYAADRERGVLGFLAPWPARKR